MIFASSFIEIKALYDELYNKLVIAADEKFLMETEEDLRV